MDHSLLTSGVGQPYLMGRRHAEIDVIAGSDDQMMRLHTLSYHCLSAVAREGHNSLPVVLPDIQAAIRAERNAMCAVGIFSKGLDGTVEIDFQNPVPAGVSEVDSANAVHGGVSREVIPASEHIPWPPGEEHLLCPAVRDALYAALRLILRVHGPRCHAPGMPTRRGGACDYSMAPRSLSSVTVLLSRGPPNSSAYPKAVHSTISPGRS